MQIKKKIQLTTNALEYLLKEKEAIDFRLDEPVWQDLYIGDIIEFWEDFSGWDKEPTANSRKILVEITNIFRASSFAQLIDELPASFTKNESKEEIIKNLRQWWNPEKENSTGVLGWQVKIISTVN